MYHSGDQSQWGSSSPLQAPAHHAHYQPYARQCGHPAQYAQCGNSCVQSNWATPDQQTHVPCSCSGHAKSPGTNLSNSFSKCDTPRPIRQRQPERVFPYIRTPPRSFKATPPCKPRPGEEPSFFKLDGGHNFPVARKCACQSCAGETQIIQCTRNPQYNINAPGHGYNHNLIAHSCNNPHCQQQMSAPPPVNCSTPQFGPAPTPNHCAPPPPTANHCAPPASTQNHCAQTPMQSPFAHLQKGVWAAGTGANPHSNDPDHSKRKSKSPKRERSRSRPAGHRPTISDSETDAEDLNSVVRPQAARASSASARLKSRRTPLRKVQPQWRSARKARKPYFESQDDESSMGGLGESLSRRSKTLRKRTFADNERGRSMFSDNASMQTGTLQSDKDVEMQHASDLDPVSDFEFNTDPEKQAKLRAFNEQLNRDRQQREAVHVRPSGAFPPAAARQSQFTTPVKQGRAAGFGSVPSSAPGNFSNHLHNASISNTSQTPGPNTFRTGSHLSAHPTLRGREFRTPSASHTASGSLRARSRKRSFDSLSPSTQCDIQNVGAAPFSSPCTSKRFGPATPPVRPTFEFGSSILRMNFGNFQRRDLSTNSEEQARSKKRKMFDCDDSSQSSSSFYNAEPSSVEKEDLDETERKFAQEEEDLRQKMVELRLARDAHRKQKNPDDSPKFSSPLQPQHNRPEASIPKKTHSQPSFQASTPFEMPPIITSDSEFCVPQPSSVPQSPNGEPNTPSTLPDISNAGTPSSVDSTPFGTPYHGSFRMRSGISQTPDGVGRRPTYQTSSPFSQSSRDKRKSFPEFSDKVRAAFSPENPKKSFRGESIFAAQNSAPLFDFTINREARSCSNSDGFPIPSSEPTSEMSTPSTRGSHPPFEGRGSDSECANQSSQQTVWEAGEEAEESLDGSADSMSEATRRRREGEIAGDRDYPNNNLTEEIMRCRREDEERHEAEIQRRTATNTAKALKHIQERRDSEADILKRKEELRASNAPALHRTARGLTEVGVLLTFYREASLVLGGGITRHDRAATMPPGNLARLKRAYKQAIKQFHPDNKSGHDLLAQVVNEEKSKILQEQYEKFRKI
eukprot:127713_1